LAEPRLSCAKKKLGQKEIGVGRNDLPAELLGLGERACLICGGRATEGLRQSEGRHREMPPRLACKAVNESLRQTLW
jgi:hypothetical protein